MEKTRLKYNNVSEIVGAAGIGLIVLTDDEKTRQISITCDEDMVRAFSLRMAHVPETNRLLAALLSLSISSVRYCPSLRL